MGEYVSGLIQEVGLVEIPQIYAYINEEILYTICCWPRDVL